jgi:hypothetical protein
MCVREHHTRSHVFCAIVCAVVKTVAHLACTKKTQQWNGNFTPNHNQFRMQVGFRETLLPPETKGSTRPAALSVCGSLFH